MKKLLPAIFVLFSVFSAASVSALPFYTTQTTFLQFVKIGSSVQFWLQGANIATTSGAADPLVGQYQSIHGSNNYGDVNFTLVSQVSDGVWTLTNAENGGVDITVNSLLNAKSQALTIDFNTGVINWTGVTNLSVPQNYLNSGTLTDFSSYQTATLSFTFGTSQELKDWISNAQYGSYGTSYTSSLNASPEPSVLLLTLFGAGLLGMFIVRRTESAC